MSLYLEDVHAGEIFESPRRTVSLEDILAFARSFDPQPFHLDVEAAKATFFGRLVGSGWHTAALTMLMMTEALDFAGGLIGMGMEDLRWPAPLLPGDTIHLHAEVVQVRASQSRPKSGIARIDVRTVREDGAVLQQMIANVLMPRHPDHVSLVE